MHGILVTIQPFEDLDESSWSVPARLNFMDDVGMLAQVVYPNGVGFSSNYIFALDDAARGSPSFRPITTSMSTSSGTLGADCSRNVCCRSGIWTSLSRRCLASSTRELPGFCISDRPELLGLPELRDVYFDPMWDLFNESGAVANFHIGAGATKAEFDGYKAELEAHLRGETWQDAKRSERSVAPAAWLSLPPQRRLTAQSSQFFMSNARIICNLCLSDLFDRFPKLKIMSAESGIGWIPFLLESLEYHFDDMIVDEKEVRFAERRPKEYFTDHIFVSFWFEHIAPQKLIEDIGVHNVMVETDFPHPTCLFPDTRARAGQSLAGVSPEVKACLLRDNAINLYGIKVS